MTQPRWARTSTRNETFHFFCILSSRTTTTAAGDEAIDRPTDSCWWNEQNCDFFYSKIRSHNFVTVAVVDWCALVWCRWTTNSAFASFKLCASRLKWRTIAWCFCVSFQAISAMSQCVAFVFLVFIFISFFQFLFGFFSPLVLLARARSSTPASRFRNRQNCTSRLRRRQSVVVNFISLFFFSVALVFRQTKDKSERDHKEKDKKLNETSDERKRCEIIRCEEVTLRFEVNQLSRFTKSLFNTLIEFLTDVIRIQFDSFGRSQRSESWTTCFFARMAVLSGSIVRRQKESRQSR